jgi:hypothetical protein
MAVTRVHLRNSPAKQLPKLHPLEGFGAQFNTNLFTTDGQDRPLTQRQLAELGELVDNLKPGHSRIFVRRGVRVGGTGDAAKQLEALMATIELAQHAGANVNLTYWGQGPYANAARLKALHWPNRTFHKWPNPNRKKWPQALTSGELAGPKVLMERFARIIETTRREGFDCITHATIQNEPNQGKTDIAKQGDQRLSMRMYEWLYRLFDTALKDIPDPQNPSRSLRKTITIVGGDLVEKSNSHQDEWLDYMRANMDIPREGFPSVVDGYSIHVYWAPGGGSEGFPAKLEQRLEHLAKKLKSLRIDKPVYVTEYGVRMPSARPKPGLLNSERMEFSPTAAFQHAWFNALAPQYGCVGLAKWVLCRTDKRGNFGEWGMIDAPNPPPPRASFERSPTYRVTRLFTHLVPPGCTAQQSGRGGANRSVLASRFAAPNGVHESVAVLNNGPPQQVLVEKLKPRTDYFAAIWNRDGTGATNHMPKVTSNAAGAVTVDVPHHCVVALSTRPMGL